MSKSANLRKAKEKKYDEFYTLLPDINNELKHYKDHFNGKIVFCNCDDPYESNFFKYFAANFNFLKLKKLIVTGYSTSPIVYTQLPLFEIKGFEGQFNRAYKIEINEIYDANGDGAINLADVEFLLKAGKGKNKLTLLKGDGDFRSQESINLLQESDIVVTNPPFSLFREYVALLMKYNKKFLIIGNQNSVAYKEIFPLIKNNNLWLGFTHPKEFLVSNFDNTENNVFTDEKGLKKAKFGNICWYTNLDIPKRHEKLILYKKYNTNDYPKYDNFNGIDVGRVSDIPIDYEGAMGVPITFMDSFNPEQFEILGGGTGDTAKLIGVTKNYRGRTDLAITKNGIHSCPFNRIIIRHKK